MTQLAAALPTVEFAALRRARRSVLWAAAAALVLGAHVAVAYAVQNFSMANRDGWRAAAGAGDRDVADDGDAGSAGGLGSRTW